MNQSHPLKISLSTPTSYQVVHSFYDIKYTHYGFIRNTLIRNTSWVFEKLRNGN